jgi:hypothetical protein
MRSVIYTECRKQAHYAECRYAECHYVECRYAECRGAALITPTNIRLSFKWLPVNGS